MHLRYDTLQSHLDKEQLASLYVLTGDEQLLLLEAADLIRKTARKNNIGEREIMTVERGFKWGQLHAANNALSLFGDRKLIELRIPGGRPGKDGSQALQEYVSELNPDNVTLITLPKLDWTTQKRMGRHFAEKRDLYRGSFHRFAETGRLDRLKAEKTESDGQPAMHRLSRGTGRGQSFGRPPGDTETRVTLSRRRT